MPNFYAGINTGMEVAGALFAGGAAALTYIFWDDVKAWGRSFFEVPESPRYWRNIPKK